MIPGRIPIEFIFYVWIDIRFSTKLMCAGGGGRYCITVVVSVSKPEM
jgi:hypothetical protein